MEPEPSFCKKSPRPRILPSVIQSQLALLAPSVSTLTKAKNPATIPRTKRMNISNTASPSLRNAKTISSNKNGADKAIANGHPRSPPSAKQNIPDAVFSPPLQFMNMDIPRNVVYMVKLDGRNEADA